ncbi:tol-pal system protein YbgF [Agrilutibacter solisilvae]
MRPRLLLATVALTLAFAAPAHAQRVSLADRVATLEARAANNQANVDMLNQLNQLRAEVQTLQAQVEELQQQNQQLLSSSKSQYIDLDSRLARLEGGAAPITPPATPVTTPATPPKAAAPVPQDRQPAVYGDPGALSQGAGERAAYDAAFGALKAGQYAQAAELFQGFLAQYPSGSFAPNALYWLGESYYVTQNYTLAREQFQMLIDRYPTHDKAPGALLKVGLSMYGARDFDGAQAALNEVVSRYPGTDAARTASDRLSAMQLGQMQR